MKVLMMLDTKSVEELDEIEAVRRICAGIAVEALMVNDPRSDDQRSTTPPESAMLDRSLNTTTKPVPQTRPAPPREKRGKRR
jgi:hypothetical protein